MSLFALLGQKLTEFKYQYYGLNIIQEVSEERFHQIISQYVGRGWELSGEYNELESGISLWSCKLRKGTSTLRCEWDEAIKGNFIGPERIIFGLGKEYGFTANKAPQ
jgi:hypothetical protein